MKTIIVLLVLIAGSATEAAAPKLINYQGRLTTAAGIPVADGFYTVRFRIYTDSTGGTSLWEETQPVQTKAGLFAAILGGTSTIPDTLFNSPNRFLGIKVNADAEITPRSRLVSTPYALETAQWTTKGSNVVRTGGVGIGTVTPTRKLEVNDTTGALHVARFGSNSTDAATIELHNTTNNSTWLLGSTGSIGAWSGVIPSKSFYLLRWGAPIPIISVDSMNRMKIAAWPDGNSVSHFSRLHVGAEYDPEVVYGISTRATTIGVLAVATGSSAVGVEAGSIGSNGIGMLTTADNDNNSYGIYAGSGAGFAGRFDGKVDINGLLTKDGGAFKIDHPLDPANKYLSHSFVESPDMKNIYDGNITTDGNGSATVTLPEWFEALNRDFRYQLTVIGGFAQAVISQKIQNNQFEIRTDKPGVEVSWQVTGIRKDAWANANRIPVEEIKPDSERGHYRHPGLYGQPEEKNLEWARRPELMQRLKAEREEANTK